MNKINELLNNLCPNGIKYVELNSICKFQNGFSFKSPLFRKSGLPILRITNISDGKITDNDFVFFNKNDYKEDLTNFEVKHGDVVVAMSGATTGKIGYNYSNNTYYLNQRVGLFVPDESKLLKRYLYHWLCSKSAEILEISSGVGAQPNLSSVKMMEFKIPLPPIEIQSKVTDLLDTFDNLDKELKKELELRNKQYEWVKQKLFKKDYPLKLKLGDLCSIEKGKTPIQKAIPGEYPLVVTTDKRSSCKDFQFDCKAVCLSLVSARGHGIAQISRIFYQEGKFALGNILCAMIPNDENQLNAKFLQYYLFYMKDILLTPLMKGGANVALHISDLQTVKIPLPPIQEQEKIVSFLNKFDELCNDETTGLPAEIKARKKQYEYYRDKLLSFKKKEVSNNE